MSSLLRYLFNSPSMEDPLSPSPSPGYGSENRFSFGYIKFPTASCPFTPPGFSREWLGYMMDGSKSGGGGGRDNYRPNFVIPPSPIWCRLVAVLLFRKRKREMNSLRLCCFSSCLLFLSFLLIIFLFINACSMPACRLPSLYMQLLANGVSQLQTDLVLIVELLYLTNLNTIAGTIWLRRKNTPHRKYRMHEKF